MPVHAPCAESTVVVSYNRIHDNGREDDFGTNDYGGFRAAMAGSQAAPVEFHHNIFANITCFQHGGNVRLLLLLSLLFSPASGI